MIIVPVEGSAINKKLLTAQEEGWEIRGSGVANTAGTQFYFWFTKADGGQRTITGNEKKVSSDIIVTNDGKRVDLLARKKAAA